MVIGALEEAKAGSHSVSGVGVSMATLVVFDFDESLVEANGFEHMARRVFPEAHPRLAGPWARGELSWPQLVNLFHELLAAEQPQVSLERVREAAASVPVHPKMLEAVRAAAARPAVDVKIVSDCATFYIDALLDRHALHGCFSEVLTNPMRVHADNPNRLEMLPFHAKPHGCGHCAANMCKGGLGMDHSAMFTGLTCASRMTQAALLMDCCATKSTREWCT